MNTETTAGILISPVVLYECRNWCFTSSKEVFKVFNNRVMKEISGCKTENIAGVE
jgi:hypothetical protein